MLQGPDVSSWQGHVDWNAVAASGRQFAWSKVTDGTNYVNPYFARNWAEMKDAGLVRGAYHYAEAYNDNPEHEADFFVNNVSDIQPADLLALDLEEGSGDLKSWTLRFLSHVTALVGFRPLLYSGRWFLDPHNVENNAELAQYGLWLSGYQATVPALPPGWATLAMWQYTDNDQIPGIGGAVDESYFFGTLEQLKAYGKPGAVAPPLTSTQQLVTIDSVIGDNTYPDGGSMYDLADNQAVSHVVFIRQLIQYAKALPGIPADSVTRLSVMGDMTYPDAVDMDSQAPGQSVSRRVFIRELVQSDKAALGA